MEWPNNKIVSFIHEMQGCRVLWDSSDPYYKISRKKNEAWENLADKFSTRVLDIKKKWLSLQASYRRERMKVINSKENGRKITSKWFAYSAMMFLGDHYKPRGRKNTFNAKLSEATEKSWQKESNDSDDDEVISELEVTHTKMEPLYETERVRLHDIPLRRRHLRLFHSPEEINLLKKRKTNEDEKPNKMYILKAVAEKECQRDENETYGEYVALTLKKLDNYSRIMAKHYINEILIEAELGKYKDSVPQRSPTSTTYSTISSPLSVYTYQGSNNVISSESNL